MGCFRRGGEGNWPETLERCHLCGNRQWGPGNCTDEEQPESCEEHAGESVARRRVSQESNAKKGLSKRTKH